VTSYETTRSRYTRVAIILHWAIAAFIIFNLALGFFMEGFQMPLRLIVVSLHVSSGITVLALTVIRVIWRLTHEPPPLPATLKLWERRLAHAVHVFLYVGMVLMPLTGWAIISAHPRAGSAGEAALAPVLPNAPGGPRAPGGPGGPPPPKIWGLFALPAITAIESIGETPGGVEPQKVLHEEFVTWHRFGGFMLLALLILHLAGALKHQFIDRELELQRMGIGRSKSDG